MKDLLVSAGVPTAAHGTFTDATPALAFLETMAPPYVVKTDGLAAGKGVVVTEDLGEAHAAVREYLAGTAFGDAGRTIVIEEGMVGPEVSVLAVCDGRRAVALAPAQDFKRIGDGDTGPNTGGMGAYSPVPVAPAALVDEVMHAFVDPTLAELARRGIDYRGVLYAGLMLTADGPRMLEYNVRFGDPEAQVVLPRLSSSLTTLLAEAAAGEIVTGAHLRLRRRRHRGLCSRRLPDRTAPGRPHRGPRPGTGHRRRRGVLRRRRRRPRPTGWAPHCRRTSPGGHRTRPRPCRCAGAGLRRGGRALLARHAGPIRHRRRCGRRIHCNGGDPAMTRIPNVLANRYASAEMTDLWSAEHKIVLERRLWLAVLRTQIDLGVDVPAGVVDAYEAVVDQVDLEAIAARERITRHDVKARIDEFCALAGHEHIHRGMTSRDLTENVEQLQIRSAMELTRDRTVAVLVRLAARAGQYADLALTARSHNVAAQVTTLGKRFATIADELLIAFDRLETVIERYPLRGMKGPVGTQQDQLDLLGSPDAVDRLEEALLAHLGFDRSVDSVGQIYPRSLDFEVVSTLVQLAAAPANLATTMRLMAGHELVTEGFEPGQVGSSAMPHKMNSRSCERINGFAQILAGHLTMVGGLVGNQWNEGDVSDSVVRRVALPDAFFAIDGLLQTLLTVLDELGAYPAVIERELTRYLPFLSTTRLLTAAVQAGAGREEAHEAIKEHAVAAALAMREQGTVDNDLAARLAADSRIALDAEDLAALLASPETGLAERQVDAVVARVADVAGRYPAAAIYDPEPIL